MDALLLCGVCPVSLHTLPEESHPADHLQPRVVRGVILVARAGQIDHRLHVHHVSGGDAPQAQRAACIEQPRECHAPARTLQEGLRAERAAEGLLWRPAGSRQLDRRRVLADLGSGVPGTRSARIAARHPQGCFPPGHDPPGRLRYGCRLPQSRHREEEVAMVRGGADPDPIGQRRPAGRLLRKRHRPGLLRDAGRRQGRSLGHCEHP